MATLDQALELWRRGLSVIPVPAPRPGVPPGQVGDGKVPAIAWREYQERLPTEDEIREGFRVEQNLAVITGRVSGIVVIDADSPEAVRYVVGHLPRTPWQVRTARGWHMYYRYPGVRVGNRARLDTRGGRLALDVRGDGGYVIGPGSIHASGRRYEMAGDWSIPREQLPALWMGWLERPRQHSQRRDLPRPTGDVVERARRYLAAIPPPVIKDGSDNATVYAAYRLVRGFALSESDAVSLLWEWAGGREGWTLDWIRAKVRNALRYTTERSEPIGGML